MSSLNPAQDHYAILEVPREATYDIIKASFHRLALLYHPDKTGGAGRATDKMKLINVAWDTLGDHEKRRVYDNSTLSQFRVSNSTPRSAAQPTHPSQPRRQPPKTNPPTKEDLRTEAESQEKLQEWLQWERAQENSIHLFRSEVERLESDEAAHNLTISQNTTKLANDIPYWWNVLAPLSSRLSESQKSALRTQISAAEAAIRASGVQLARAREIVQQLHTEMKDRRTLEEERQTHERRARERREYLAREEEQRKYTHEAREKAEKKRKDDEAFARLYAHFESMRSKKEDGERRQKMRTCEHNMWWDKVDGARRCQHCSKPMHKFALQCPGCQTVACYACMKGFRSGCMSGVDDEKGGEESDSRSVSPDVSSYDASHGYY
ncbi:DnaJ-domain-containing protein [Ophiobolus disseminans]|uniref:DnaJ-domain-containing protein n=1 Tax=Ophiobolus disseminans TaxID=1469910 RepID=A0A6A6ZKM9_9PLEO|nr:DnaJ-domain-containing protein [Ophiobolus disseminans]